MLRTKRGDYYIEPSKHHQVNDAGHYPHIIFQRSAIKVNKFKSILESLVRKTKQCINLVEFLHFAATKQRR